MHTVGVKTVPARALGPATIAFAVKLTLILVDDVVFARHIVHIEPRVRNNAIGIVELRRFRQMRDVARVDHERRLDRQRFHSPDRFFERALGIRIGGLVETHVTVADLQEGETLALLRQRFVDDAERGRYSARNSPQHTCSRPGHTFQNLATAGALLVIVCAHVRLLQLAAWTGSDFAQIYSRTSFGEWRRLGIYPKAMKFLDEAKVYIASGAGGNGCISFRREKFIEF